MLSTSLHLSSSTSMLLSSSDQGLLLTFIDPPLATDSESGQSDRQQPLTSPSFSPIDLSVPIVHQSLSGYSSLNSSTSSTAAIVDTMEIANSQPASLPSGEAEAAAAPAPPLPPPLSPPPAELLLNDLNVPSSALDWDLHSLLAGTTDGSLRISTNTWSELFSNVSPDSINNLDPFYCSTPVPPLVPTTATTVDNVALLSSELATHTSALFGGSILRKRFASIAFADTALPSAKKRTTNQTVPPAAQQPSSPLVASPPLPSPAISVAGAVTATTAPTIAVAATSEPVFQPLVPPTPLSLLLMQQPSSTTVYRRFLRPSPKLALRGTLPSPDDDDKLWVEVSLTARDSETPLSGKCLSGVCMEKISFDRPVTLDKVKILYTTRQKDTVFRLRFDLKRHTGQGFETIASAAVFSQPITVYSHTDYVKRTGTCLA